jgi:hypothetical protein
MSDEDASMEQVHEQIHHHAHEAMQRWISGAALTAALLAALAAITGSLAGKHLTESSRNQIQSNDQWGYFQAKSIKSGVLQSKMELLSALGKPAAEKDKEKLHEYEAEMKEKKKEAEEKAESSEIHLHLHEILERGVTLFHIAIAVVAIAVLTKRKLFWFVSLAFGLVGVGFMVQGLLRH